MSEQPPDESYPGVADGRLQSGRSGPGRSIIVDTEGHHDPRGKPVEEHFELMRADRLDGDYRLGGLVDDGSGPGRLLSMSRFAPA